MKLAGIIILLLWFGTASAQDGLKVMTNEEADAFVTNRYDGVKFDPTIFTQRFNDLKALKESMKAQRIVQFYDPINKLNDQSSDIKMKYDDKTTKDIVLTATDLQAMAAIESAKKELKLSLVKYNQQLMLISRELTFVYKKLKDEK